ncbi:MAG: formyltetrahydrofolate deformylase [Planctomycetaceae bacterium]|nr:formyltetrahydrofolate deformylase [Planctomycetaceae bacterium]
MQVVITAVGPDNRGLADPLVHWVTGGGANIHEIQMYDHDLEQLFAMLLRIEWNDATTIPDLRAELTRIGQQKGLTVRVWCRGDRSRPRVALCTTYRPEPAKAVLEGVRSGTLQADVPVMIGNRDTCQRLAQEHGVEFVNIGDAAGNPDNARLVQLADEYDIDYIVLARYMRVLPARTCWEFAGGRIINLHHGLLPPFPGFRPYHDAFSHHMLTYGATIHFIVPELDAGNQIIHQDAFAVSPGTPLDEIVRIGEREHEPRCLHEGLRRVLDREVELHFHRVVRRSSAVE